MRKLLRPLSWLYGSGVKLRNHLYDTGTFKRFEFDLPVITVGNLNTGGTGKTPHCLFLLSRLSEFCQPGFVSRGYKRKTQGFVMADAHSTAWDIGDEPMLVKHHYPDVPVAVGEERIMAIPGLMMEAEGTDCVILDDAFQHRKVIPSLSILLTDYSDLYTRDELLPSGNLREPVTSAERANIIIVTKCPRTINLAERQAITAELRPKNEQIVLFSWLDFDPAYHLLEPSRKLDWSSIENVLLCCGIARRQSLLQYFDQQTVKLEVKAYSDHFYFLEKDLKQIDRTFDQLAKPGVIMTTEKDAMRFLLFRKFIEEQSWPIFALPIRVAMSIEDENKLFERIRKIL